MELATIIYEKKGSVALVTLNRPETLNATNRQMWQDLTRVMDEVEKDDEVRVMIITGITVQTRRGERRTFSTGADLKESPKRTVREYRKYLQFLQKISLRLIRFPKPTIAAINGFALGSGYELALACDLRIAAEDALIGSPEAKVSSSVTGGATRLLPVLVGMAKAKELLFTCQYITGKEAEKIGLVNKAVPVEKLLEGSFAMAEQIAQNSPLSIRVIKSQLEVAQTGKVEDLMKKEVEGCIQTVFAPEREKAIKEFEGRKK